jgi:ATP-binding cassette, subfamily B, bacterial
MARSEFTVQVDRQSNRSSTGRWIASYLTRNKWIMVGIVLGAAGNAGLAAVIPVVTGFAFDSITGANPNLRSLLWMTLIMVFTQLVRFASQLARNFGSEVLGQRLERDARQELYASLLGKSMAFHDLRPTGELMARATNDVRELALMTSTGFNLVLGSANFLFVPLLVAPGIHPQLILVPAIFIVAYAVAMYFYLRALQPVSEQLRARFGNLNAHLTEAIEGIETIKGAAQEAHEIRQFEHEAGNFRNAFVNLGQVEARFLPLLLLGLTQGFAFWHALALYQQGQISVGDIVAYMGLIGLFTFPVNVSLFAYSQAASGVASARRILELVVTETELDQNVGGYEAPMRGVIRFDNVSFRYAVETERGTAAVVDSSPALEQVSFEVAAGQTLALVGQTGSGKSTIAKLVNRIYDVNEGTIYVDGVDVREWDLAALRRQISIIEQDIFLYSRSIAENIAFGKPDATEAEIIDAARAAQAHDFIMTFPEGYQTTVGERGVTLSGGQRQRIALARAFLTDPAILILDDSTSAIDSATEDQIQQAIEKATRGRTTILITHRLSQIRWADKIVVLRQGRIADSGTHEELLARSSAYQDIFARL